jgi:Fic family protein
MDSFFLGAWGINVFYDRAGHYTKYWDEAFSTHDFYTFNPTPVCEINIKTDDELCGLLSNAQRLLGLLEGTSRYINGIDNITSLMLKKEAAASCKIDDEIKFSYLDLFTPSKNKADKIVPVLNYTKALDYGIGELKRIRLTNKVIFSTHEVLMEHKRDTKIIGTVREKQNIIGEYIVTVSGMENYNPPEPGEISSCMADIQRFIKRNDNIDVLIKVALLHYQLEVVHPFESGNGKIGRILILMYLFEKQILSHTLIPISEFLEAHKVEYFDRIKAVHNRGDYEQWVKFFLSMLAVVTDISIRQIEKALQLRDRNIALIRANEKDVKYLLDAYHYIERCGFIDVNSLADGIGVSYNTAARVARTMVELGILKLLKSQARNRIYYYADFLDAMGFVQNINFL